MVPTDGVLDDAVTTRSHWRGVLMGAALAIGVGLLVLLAPQQARADDRPSLVGTLGSVVGEVTSTVENVVAPVVEPLPSLRELPVVGGRVGEVADSRPVATITEPVNGLLTHVLGSDVVAPVTQPVADLVDGTVAELAGVPAVPPAAPAEPDGGALVPDTEAATAASDTASVFTSASSAALTVFPLLTRVGELGIAVATGAEGPDPGPVSLPGGLTPSSAVTSASAPIGAAAAVLGAGLLLLLARGRTRLTVFRAPPSPVYATDASPD